jgi:hypothetical protein
MPDKLTNTLLTVDRLLQENNWRRPIALFLTADDSQAISKIWNIPNDQLKGMSYYGVPIASVDAEALRLEFPSVEDLDSTPMTRTCSIEEGGACESCQ